MTENVHEPRPLTPFELALNETENLLNMHKMDVKTLEEATYKRQKEIERFEEEQVTDKENLARVRGGASALASALTKQKFYYKQFTDEEKRKEQQAQTKAVVPLKPPKRVKKKKKRTRKK